MWFTVCIAFYRDRIQCEIPSRRGLALSISKTLHTFHGLSDLARASRRVETPSVQRHKHALRVTSDHSGGDGTAQKHRKIVDDTNCVVYSVLAFLCAFPLLSSMNWYQLAQLSYSFIHSWAKTQQPISFEAECLRI